MSNPLESIRPYHDELVTIRAAYPCTSGAGHGGASDGGAGGTNAREVGDRGASEGGKTGVAGVLRNGLGNKAIGLRADVDALPMTEATGCRRPAPSRYVCSHCGGDRTRPPGAGFRLWRTGWKLTARAAGPGGRARALAQPWDRHLYRPHGGGCGTAAAHPRAEGCFKAGARQAPGTARITRGRRNAPAGNAQAGQGLRAQTAAPTARCQAGPAAPPTGRPPQSPASRTTGSACQHSGGGPEPRPAQLTSCRCYPPPDLPP